MARSRSASSGSASASEDEGVDYSDDPVVKRLPVYYLPHYLHSLTLLQYPDRPPRPDSTHPLLPPSLRPSSDSSSSSTSATTTRISGQYKPHSQHLSLSVPIERLPDRYDDDRGKQFGAGVLDQQERGEARDAAEGKSNKKRKKTKGEEQAEQEERARREEMRDNRRLDKISYSSTTVPDVTNYLVGIVKHGQSSISVVSSRRSASDFDPLTTTDALHLSPLTQTYQLRPSLTYLDHLLTLERRRKREQRHPDSDSEGDISDTEIKKEEAKAVQVSVKQSVDLSGGGAFGKMGGGGGGGLANGRAGAGLFAPLRAEEGEQWQELEYYHADVSFLPFPFWKKKKTPR